MHESEVNNGKFYNLIVKSSLYGEVVISKTPILTRSYDKIDQFRKTELEEKEFYDLFSKLCRLEFMSSRNKLMNCYALYSDNNNSSNRSGGSGMESQARHRNSISFYVDKYLQNLMFKFDLKNIEIKKLGLFLTKVREDSDDSNEESEMKEEDSFIDMRTTSVGSLQQAIQQVNEDKEKVVEFYKISHFSSDLTQKEVYVLGLD